MSLADFNDFLKICSDWETEFLFSQVLVTDSSVPPRELPSDPLLSRKSDPTVKEMLLEKRETVLN